MSSTMPPKLKELSNIKDPKQLLIALEDLVAQLQMWLASDSTLLLEGLDAHVERLCQGVLNMPEEAGRELAPRLEILANQLGELGGAMQQERNLLHGELTQLQQWRKAHQAYGKRGTVPVQTPDKKE